MSPAIYWTSGPLGRINPVAGCHHKSEACDNCYAEEQHMIHHAAKKPVPFFSRPFNEVTLRPEQLKKFDQLRRKKEPVVCFVGNMCDLFHEEVPFEYIQQVFEKIPTNHTFLFLTKRAERMRQFITDFDTICQTTTTETFAECFPNVWLGVTAELQARADERIPLLLETPAAHRWISIEPFLRPMDLTSLFPDTEKYPGTLNAFTGENRYIDEAGEHVVKLPKLDLVICGGESGPKARRMDPEWARNIGTDCMMAGVKFYFKQYGDAYCRENHMKDGQYFDGVDYSRLTPAEIWRAPA